MDISIQDIRMECLKLAVYAWDETCPDKGHLELSERYVDYVQNGVRKPAPVLNLAEISAKFNAEQYAVSRYAEFMSGANSGDSA